MSGDGWLHRVGEISADDEGVAPGRQGMAEIRDGAPVAASSRWKAMSSATLQSGSRVRVDPHTQSAGRLSLEPEPGAHARAAECRADLPGKWS